MDALILAAGLGTRLRPLTDHTPKALVEVGGMTMLERVGRRLIRAGVDRLVINVHHHADRIRRFVKERGDFGAEVRFSDEPDHPLETGGGLLHARGQLRADRPFFLHNVDVITDLPLEEMYAEHERAGALATLAVSDRESSRLLRFDSRGLQARVRADGRVEAARPAVGATRDRAFAGVHVLSPAFLDLIEERGVFSIMAPYLRLAGLAQPILPFDIGSALWLEIGNADRLEHARRQLGPPCASS